MSVNANLVQDTFVVHEPCSVRIVAASDRDLRAGDTVEVQFPQSWSLVTGPSFTRDYQGTEPAAPHYFHVHAPHTAAYFGVEVRERTLHYPEGGHRHGRHLVATLHSGTVPADTPIHILYANTYAPFVAETDTVWLRVKGEEPVHPPRLTVTAGPGESLRVIAPSGVKPGERFGVLIVSLDRFENASASAFRDESLALLDGTSIASHLNFTGRVHVPVMLPEPGIYRFRFRDTVSNAVHVAANSRGPYWGDIHIHTKLSHDAQGTDPYGYARDVSGLDFGGVTDHVGSLGKEGFRQTLQWAEEANEPGRFVTIPADERNPSELTGHHNVYYRDAEAFVQNRLVSAARPRLPNVDGVVLDPARVMVLPHHTGISFGPLAKANSAGQGNAVDFDAWDDSGGLRPVMEIYSHHGQSEVYCPQHILAYEFNRTRNPERRGNTSIPGPYYAQEYWMKGLRLGVIGSSDEHSGQGGRRHGGIAAVWSDNLTREQIFDSIRARHCYATTGERMLLDFSVDGIPMGDCAVRKQGQPLAVNLSVWGTDILLRVEILRFRFGQDTAFRPILAEPPRPERLDAHYELTDECTGPCMYYARVTQEPLSWPAMAWTSPVWIDTQP